MERHAGMDGRHPGTPDASGDIHVSMDSSTPCWNDTIEESGKGNRLGKEIIDPMATNDPASTHGPAGVSRRSFLFGVGAALNVIAATLLAIPVIRYVFSSFRRNVASQSWIMLGALENFPENQTRLATYRNPYTRPWDGTTANIPCWVRRLTGEKFQVFAINCAHLGCPVRWFEESSLFMCPCHGGVYYEDGARASGPPPRGLYEYEYKIEQAKLWVRGGQLPTLSEPL